MTDEEADEKEKREDDVGCLTESIGCCLIDLFIAATAFVGLMFLPFHLLR